MGPYCKGSLLSFIFYELFPWNWKRITLSISEHSNDSHNLLQPKQCVSKWKNRSKLSSHINRDLVLHWTWSNTDKQVLVRHHYFRLVLQIVDEVTTIFQIFFGTNQKVAVSTLFGKEPTGAGLSRKVIMKEKWGLESKHFLSQSVLSWGDVQREHK